MFTFVYNNIDFAHKFDPASEPSEDYGKHLHYFNEIIYFVKGEVKYTVESETYKLSEGNIVLIPAGKYHFATVNSNVPYERYVLKFPSGVLPENIQKKLLTNGSFFSNAKKFLITFRQLDSYYGKYSDDDLYTLFICETTKLLVMLYNEPIYTSNQKNGIIAELVAYIDENIREPISLTTLNERFNFSKSYISNEFRKYMKIPIIQYIRAKKIIAAHQMILSGEKKTTVAEMFGFEDYSTFYRSYVKVMGFAPSESREQDKQEK